MSAPQKKRVRSEEEIAKFASDTKGKPRSDEHRANLSKAANLRWRNSLERNQPITVQRLKVVIELLKSGASRKEIAVEPGLSKARTRTLVLLAQQNPEPILPED